MLKNLYTYLDEINFETRIKEKVKEIKKAKDDDFSFNAVVSNMVMTNWAFNLITDVFDKVYTDINKKDE